MKFKIISSLCLAALLLFGVVLAQTNSANQQSNSNTLTNTRPLNSNSADNRVRMTNSPNSNGVVPEVKSVACKYFTVADAEKILGIQLFYYSSMTYENTLNCFYKADKNYPNNSSDVSIKTQIFATIAKAQIAYKIGIKSANLKKIRFPKDFGTVTLKELEGIGDVATLIRKADIYAVIFFQKNKTVIELNVYREDGKPISTDVLESVAKKMAENF